MRFFFCRVGWMGKYAGQTTEDQIHGGGAYVESGNVGHEACNFAPHLGEVYGYVRPLKGQQIKIERLGSKPDADSISDVTVIWTAKRPEGGTVIVGWYESATVYRHRQDFLESPPPCHKKHQKHNTPGYWVNAKEINAKLLPIR